MSINKINVGSFISCLSVHNIKVFGYVEAIFQNTLIVREYNKKTHVVKKKDLTKNGYLITKEQTALHKKKNC